jgi:hypothetical protein
MPPKKKQRQGITNSDTIAALNRVSSSANTFSRGAIEALRLCHARFIVMLGLELSVLCSDDAIVTLQPSHVDECLEKLKWTHYKPQVQAKSDHKKEAAAVPFVSKKRRKQKKRKQWSAELQQEQETLLAQSKQTMQQQQQQLKR